jgi:coenzyme F420-reducing hydrogenase alpha subunit
VLDSGEASLGQTGVSALPVIPDAELISRLSDGDALDFIARPTWQGQPRETSPFTRGLATPLVQSLVEQHGAGLLPRLAAQLLEVATLFRVLVGDSAAMADAEPQAPTAATATGIGLGRTHAARGLLVHLVRVDDGRIADYRILAPTEWNFHPEGVVARALSTISPSTEIAIRRQADLLITAIDPCVAFELRLS